jgi:hypothetical protein
MSLSIGAQKIVADGVIGGSGKKIRVYEFIVRAGGSDAVVAVYNGTSTGGTQYDAINVTANTTNRIPYAGGLSFQDGCYLDIDSNTTFVVAIYEQENS